MMNISKLNKTTVCSETNTCLQYYDCVKQILQLHCPCLGGGLSLLQLHVVQASCYTCRSLWDLGATVARVHVEPINSRYYLACRQLYSVYQLVPQSRNEGLVLRLLVAWQLLAIVQKSGKAGSVSYTLHFAGYHTQIQYTSSL